MRRIGLLDLLRAAAAALVLLAHVAFWTGASSIGVGGALLARGDSGVAVFFALSAFLLLRPWIADGPPPALREYAAHRAARILPAYWAALAAVLLAAAVIDGSVGGAGTVVAHLLLVQGFTGASYQSFSQTWSLTTEATFYVLVPLLGPALGRSARANPRRALAAIAGVAVLGLAAQTVAVGAGASALAVSAVGHAAWFAAGAAVCVWRCRPGLWQPDERPGAWLLAAVVVYLAAATPVAGPLGLSAPTTAQALAKELLYALFALLALAAATTPLQAAGELADVAGHPLTRWLGDVSYPVFLWHVLVLQVLYRATGLGLFTGLFWQVLIAVATLTLLISAASARWLEQPARRWARRRAAPAPAR